MKISAKKAEFNFVWLFAIIAGTAILLLAISGAVRYGKTSSDRQNTEVGKEIAIITEPMQAGFTDFKKATIKFKKETLIESECSEDNFGYNEILVTIKDRPNEDFELPGVPIRVTNKYLFISEKSGKNFYVFSVPVSFAFRIADAVIMDSQEYCFLGEYEPFRNDLSILGSGARFDSANCTEDSIKVCFGLGSGCDINVRGDCTNPSVCENEFEVGSVEKDGERVDYAGNLIYPAIFSSKELYECNLKRLMYRQSVLTNLYLEKAEFMSSRNCNNEIGFDLEELGRASFDFSSDVGGEDLKDIYLDAKLLKETERGRQCKLWTEV